MPVDLRAAPYFLSDTDIGWVNSTYESMSHRERIDQLFVHLLRSTNVDEARAFLENHPVGAVRYAGGSPEEVQDLIAAAQKTSRLPLLVAGNADAGGNGLVDGGTYIASPAQAEATGTPQTAYRMGLVAGREARALGVNWLFNPVVDILGNWRNTIVNNRSFGTNSHDVLMFARAYILGAEEAGIATCAKHFPGDGAEERDQHLLMGINELGTEKWDTTYGRVYRSLIQDGLPSIMAGHIALPSYSRALRPGIADSQIMPATLSRELITGLLRARLGFNGVVVTDASHMLGMAASMRRRDYVPRAIASGCDMFLFFNEPEEDIAYMEQGVEDGMISTERVREAVIRVLALKARLRLHERHGDRTRVPGRNELAVIGSDEHRSYAHEAADRGITLVKDTQDALPITASTHPRIILYLINADTPATRDCAPAWNSVVVEELGRAGFSVTVNDGSTRIKGSVEAYRRAYDAAFIFADVSAYAIENNPRLRWRAAQSNEAPWYVHELPTVFVSLHYTTHLNDVPMVKTYINAYGAARTVIRHTIEKITGVSEFTGTPNEHVWCDRWDTRL